MSNVLRTCFNKILHWVPMINNITYHDVIRNSIAFRYNFVSLMEQVERVVSAWECWEFPFSSEATPEVWSNPPISQSASMGSSCTAQWNKLICIFLPDLLNQFMVALVFNRLSWNFELGWSSILAILFANFRENR